MALQKVYKNLLNYEAFCHLTTLSYDLGSCSHYSLAIGGFDSPEASLGWVAKPRFPG
jgi:hypothetical protein